MILAAAVLTNHCGTAQEHTYKSQHETILADLNQYSAKTWRLLMDDAITYMCILAISVM